MSMRPRDLRDLRWETYAWLIYSLPFLISSLIYPPRLWMKGAFLLLYFAFLVLYFAGYFIRGPRILWIVAGIDAIGVVASVWNPGAVSFFIFAASFIANGFSTRTAANVLAVQVMFGGVVALLLKQEWWFALVSVVISALIGAITIQARAKEAGDAKLRMAQEEVERLAKLAERERIARDLHDLLGHTLSVVVLKSELAQKVMEREPQRARQEIAEVERIARQGLADVRQAVTGYRSSGLTAEIEHVGETLTAAGIDTTIEARAVHLAPAQETALSLALREAATNVIRHAAATKCHIRFYAKDGSALMEVQDDGRGGDAPFGNGLNGMRERIHALGGMLQRLPSEAAAKEGEIAHGTRLMISLPL
jgi:two-component system, NarL family, sensor histidine kinase DesK